MQAKRVGVLGGGIGGVVAANVLRGAVRAPVDIGLIDRRPDHFFPPSYLHVMTGELDPHSASASLSSLERRRIQPIVGEIVSIDPRKRSVTVDRDTFEFDYLIVALGAEIALQSIQGLETCHTFQTLDGAIRLRDALKDFTGGQILIVITGSPYRCPDAPYEAAFLLDDLLRRRGLREKSSVHVATVEPGPMPIAGEAVAGKIRKMLAERSIEYSTGRRLVAVDENRALATFADATQQPYELIIVVPPLLAPQVVSASGLCADTGWISSGPFSLATMFDGVFAVGDACSVRIPNGRYLPKLGVFATRQAVLVAENLAAQIDGDKEQRLYTGEAEVVLETGRGRAASLKGDFYAKPEPKLKLKAPTKRKHLSKAAYERRWLKRWL
ncbi:MAG: NAD(P)/FAD-dependent oxidoreductase [Actinobacteria bacterium]|nr:MAG: NAD(P)/FAD-dependent oxidoreductase [Actinomycetota bacterium]